MDTKFSSDQQIQAAYCKETGGGGATFINPNVCATFLLMLYSIALAFTFKTGDISGRLRNSRVWLLLVGVFALGIVLTQSRGSFIAMLVVTVLAVFLNKRFWRGHRIGPIFLMLLAGIAVPLITIHVLGFERILLLGIRELDSRVIHWQGLIEIFQRSPLVGVGPGFMSYKTAADNEYIYILTSYGLIGFAAYIVLILLLFSRIVRMKEPYGLALRLILMSFLLLNGKGSTFINNRIAPVFIAIWMVFFEFSIKCQLSHANHIS